MDPTLEHKIVACPTLPSLPAVALEVVALCRKEDLEVGEVVALIERDPALAAKVLRVSNSASVAARSKVATLSRALALLGTNTVLTLALSFSLVREGRRAGGQGSVHASYWHRALLCAIAARALAPDLGLDPEELFLASLLQDLGVLALLEALPGEYAQVVAEAGGDHARLVLLERARLGTDHAEVSAFLAARWNLPDLVVETARGSHDPALAGAGPELARAVACVHLAGLLAEVWTGAEPDGAQGAAERHLGLDTAALGAALERMASAILDAAGDFEVKLGTAAEVEDALDRANEALALLSARADRSSLDAERAAAVLETETRSLAERATHDALTGVLNRAELERVAQSAFERAVERGAPLTIAFCDIDHFKLVNDQHGHAAGDRVLAGVARAIAGAARPGDAVARWGGEEFVVVLPDLSARSARAVAERIRRAVEDERLEEGGGPLKVTISVGQATHAPGAPFEGAAALLAAADGCLYEAKRGGRNRVVGRG
ncbi:MAG: HDOD domain-containing protein [Anaeromyxobacteraceae bacterium]